MRGPRHYTEKNNSLRSWPVRFFGGKQGMSSVELVVSICVMAVVAAVFVPAYITYVQQTRVLSLVLPRLQQLETNIALFYFFEKRLPNTADLPELLGGIDSENLEVELAGGVVNLTVVAPQSSSRLYVLDGATMIASPVMGAGSISTWHLDGELADRLGISN